MSRDNDKEAVREADHDVSVSVPPVRDDVAIPLLERQLYWVVNVVQVIEEQRLLSKNHTHLKHKNVCSHTAQYDPVSNPSDRSNFKALYISPLNLTLNMQVYIMFSRLRDSKCYIIIVQCW